MGALSKLRVVFKKYPLLRGMASYSIIWPVSSLIQQSFEGKNIDNYDWWRSARYGLYGSCYVAPTLYSWLTVANVMWPGNTLQVGLIKTLVETLTYTPFAMCSFYFGMSLLEMKPFHEALAEVEAKFLPTYKIGASIWPAVAMVNFCLIPPRNRVPFISLCSLIWTCFLAYMKQIDKEKIASESPVQLLKPLKLVSPTVPYAEGAWRKKKQLTTYCWNAGGYLGSPGSVQEAIMNVRALGAFLAELGWLE